MNKLPRFKQLKGRPPVFILGAGFSRDFNAGLLPLSDSFLETAETTGHLQPSSKHKTLVEFINKYFRDYKKANIENVATFLTSSLLPDEIDHFENRPQLYSDLLDVIVDTIDNVHQTPLTAETDAMYQFFAQLVVNLNATIITFNYDLILDTLLRRTGLWSCLNGYGCEMRVVGNPTEKLLTEKELIPLSKGQYLKLHGSVNWGKLSVPPIYEPSSVYLSTGSLPIAGPGGGLLPIMSVKRSGISIHSGSQPNIIVRPFIVPPILTKKDFRNEPLLNNVWYMAKDAIWKSSNLFIIGYSFPPTDFLFEFLLRQIVGSKLKVFSDSPNDLRQIYLVQPKFEERYVERVEVIFGDSLYFYYENGTLEFLKTLWSEYHEEF